MLLEDVFHVINPTIITIHPCSCLATEKRSRVGCSRGCSQSSTISSGIRAHFAKSVFTDIYLSIGKLVQSPNRPRAIRTALNKTDHFWYLDSENSNIGVYDVIRQG